ncbi:DUF7489 domain-containing protein [Streptomyces mangrovisoli]|uniref:DUF7489 domain-containing protein n=1 Tax=Streptomyces mangrovisoli TaxID=1428628 RepID=A0A1J4NUM2_9ACTN|nr:hypothetical protein [Streptomyces mangrovisoli]OIJ66000.1 hypothetical protein WN71_020230 [Streptomyces mangrovisoli]
MFTSRKPGPDDAWEGIVEGKSRGMLDGANIYHFAKVRLADGRRVKVRVDRGLWKSLAAGDRIVKEPGSNPARS